MPDSIPVVSHTRQHSRSLSINKRPAVSVSSHSPTKRFESDSKEHDHQSLRQTRSSSSSISERPVKTRPPSSSISEKPIKARSPSSSISEKHIMTRSPSSSVTEKPVMARSPSSSLSERRKATQLNISSNSPSSPQKQPHSAAAVVIQHSIAATRIRGRTMSIDITPVSAHSQGRSSPSPPSTRTPGRSVDLSSASPRPHTSITDRRAPVHLSASSARPKTAGSVRSHSIFDGSSASTAAAAAAAAEQQTLDVPAKAPIVRRHRRSNTVSILVPKSGDDIRQPRSPITPMTPGGRTKKPKAGPILNAPNSGRMWIDHNDSPAPGSYKTYSAFTPDPKKGIKIHERIQFKDPKELLPGPGSYSIKPVMGNDGPVASMSGSARSELFEINSDVPSVGSYDLPSTIGQGPAASIRSKIEYKDPHANTAGPGAYDGAYQSSLSSRGGHAMATSSARDELFVTDLDSAAPGQYEIPSTIGQGPSATMHARTVDPMQVGATITPGVGEYDVKFHDPVVQNDFTFGSVSRPSAVLKAFQDNKRDNGWMKNSSGSLDPDL